MAANLIPATPNRPTIIVHNAVRIYRNARQQIEEDRLLPPGPAPRVPQADNQMEKLKKWWADGKGLKKNK